MCAVSQASSARSLLRLSRSDTSASSVSLYCFPFAGGSAHYYQHWANQELDSLKGYAIELPGRGLRLKEPPALEFSELLQDLVGNISPILKPPYVFFGHSMGALLAFEFTRMLECLGLPLPAHLFLSACRAPHLRSRSRPWHSLPEQELIEEVERLEGTSTGALQNEDIRSLMVPILRADFRLAEQYTYLAKEPTSVPVSVFGGTEDPLIEPSDLAKWSEHTKDFRGSHLYQGGHFYLNDHTEDVINKIKNAIAPPDEI